MLGYPLTKLDVIIINWNTKSVTLECLRSILKHPPSFPIQVIVVDNCSTDGSQDAIRQNFPDVNLIENDSNLGYGRACNIGIKKSKSPFIALLNSDIEITRNCFDVLVSFLIDSPEVAIVGPKVLNIDGSIQSSCREFPSVWNNLCTALRLDIILPSCSIFSGEHMHHFDHSFRRTVEGLVGCFLLLRRSAIDDVGLMDEQFFMYFEETDWCQRFRQKGWQIVFEPAAVVIHHDGASSKIDKARFSYEQMVSRLKYWKKYHPSYKIILIKAIYIFVIIRRIIFLYLQIIFIRTIFTENILQVRSLFRMIRLIISSH